MYDKYFLTEDQLNVINNWSQTKNEPLFIFGGSGVGKTSLAKDILKDTSLTLVDSLFLKNNTNIFDYLMNIIQKKNITLMFSEQKENRGLLIDDLELFHKYDKKSYKLVIDFLTKYKYYNTKIIIISSLKFSNHKTLNKLRYSKINLVYNFHFFHKIVNNICLNCNKNLSFKEKNNLIVRSNYNLNTFISLLNTNEIIKTQELDNFSSEEILLENLFQNDYNCKDIIRLYEPCKIKVSLDLLENLFTYFKDINIICKIYNYYVISDIFDTIFINYQDIGEYSTALTIYYFHVNLKKNNYNYLGLINNKYISHSLITTHAQKLNYEYNSKYKKFILIYLFMIKNNNYNEKIIQKIFEINKKELEFYIKSFNYFYNSKIKIEKIYKLLK